MRFEFKLFETNAEWYRQVQGNHQCVACGRPFGTQDIRLARGFRVVMLDAVEIGDPPVEMGLGCWRCGTERMRLNDPNWMPPATWKIDETAKAESSSAFPPNFRAGHVYLVGCEDGFSMIGRAKNLDARLTAMRIQLPFKIELIHSIEVDDPFGLEAALHKRFKDARMNGNWFNLNPDDLEWFAALETDEQLRNALR